MKPTQLLSFLLLGVLAFVGKTIALPEESYIEPYTDRVEGPSYRWLIGEEEASRISDLIGHDVRELGFLGFNMGTLPKSCPHCGKQTEVFDWFYTALGRGIHSKEWIIKALRDGTISRKNAHDVYCSQCGHITDFRDPTGDEGSAPHIHQATTYDHVRKTFRVADWKRSETDTDSTAPSEDSEEVGWRTLWLLKKDSASVEESDNTASEDTAAAGWRTSWLIKKDDEATQKDTEITEPSEDVATGWLTLWIIKRDVESTESTDNSDAVGWHPSWLIKKDVDDSQQGADDSKAEPAAVGWHPSWLIKKDVDDSQQGADDSKVEPAAVGWHPSWLIKKDEEVAEDSTDSDTTGWRTSWLLKRSDQAEL